MIVYLAHLGCFVPASSAVVPVFDQLRTRIQTVDSLSLGLSAFAVDLNQMALALRARTERSLLLVDEFGKGTAETDGQALLAASLEELLTEPRPYVIVSTHFHAIQVLMNIPVTEQAKLDFFLVPGLDLS